MKLLEPGQLWQRRPTLDSQGREASFFRVLTVASDGEAEAMRISYKDLHSEDSASICKELMSIRAEGWISANDDGGFVVSTVLTINDGHETGSIHHHAQRPDRIRELGPFALVDEEKTPMNDLILRAFGLVPKRRDDEASNDQTENPDAGETD